MGDSEKVMSGKHDDGLQWKGCEWDLVGCFKFNGPLRQYSVYIGLSPKEREKEKKNDRQEKKCPNNPTCTYCKRSRPLPYSNPNKEDALALEVYPAPSHHPTTPLRVRSKIMGNSGKISGKYGNG